MIEFLAFGTLWFFVISGIIFIALIVSIFNDADGWLWGTGLILLAFLFASGTWSFDWLLNNPLIILRNVGIYIGLGVLWSLKEWYSYSKSLAAWLMKQTNFHGVHKTTEQMIEGIKEKLKLEHHWGRITKWVTYFPLYFVAWALKDPIRLIATKFSFVYNTVSKNILNSTIKELTKEENK